MKQDQKITWLDDLDQVLDLARRSSHVSLATLVQLLSGKGVFIVFMLLSLPFCLPLQIPGLSTPFGILIGLLSLRLIFKKHTYMPKWILRKHIKSTTLIKIASAVKRCFVFFQKFTRRRLLFVAQEGWIHKLHGLFIFCCSLILALPIPIPFTNFFVASPILCISLGFLEEDGLFILIGYGIVSLAALILVKTL